MTVEQHLAQLAEKVTRLDGRVQAQSSANATEDIIQNQISLLIDIQQKAIARQHYDTALQISVEITKLATLTQQPARR